ncbi:hypothetical protein LSH36_873g00070 [Paralvinella palmiformis]|uniref:Uncharacterized protein n=1 Tax=Paralvinella palmiformis TaxID=53620 RepID=A0AAD9IZ06_9ANNE|nr:hypothetical protein LSH36_873g00070 [Paralvinella palmiformis]
MNTEALLIELGWSKLQYIRVSLSQTLLYKMGNQLTPAYLINLLPLRQDKSGSYPTTSPHPNQSKYHQIL